MSKEKRLPDINNFGYEHQQYNKFFHASLLNMNGHLKVKKKQTFEKAYYIEGSSKTKQNIKINPGENDTEKRRRCLHVTKL